MSRKPIVDTFNVGPIGKCHEAHDATLDLMSALNDESATGLWFLPDLTLRILIPMLMLMRNFFGG